MAKDLKILLVDDDEDEYILLNDLIRRMPAGKATGNVHLDWVDSIHAALQRIAQETYDIYFVDYFLGAETGLDLLRQLAERGSTTPVVILTGQSSYDVDLAAMQTGAEDYLVKDSLTPYALERAIRYTLERKRARDELEMRVQDRTRALAEANENLKGEIAARTRVEEALRASETRLRVLAETTSAAIFIVQDGEIRYANTAAKFVTGYSPDELSRMQFWQLAHPAYQDSLKQRGLIHQWIAGVPARFELKIVNKKGEERWVDITAGEMDWENQRASVITAFDITERDRAERELQQAKAELEARVEDRTSELRKANQRLETVLQTLPVAIWIANEAGQVAGANAMVGKIIGGLPREPAGSLSDLKAWWPESGQELKPEHWALSRALYHGETTIGDVIDYERLDGSRGTILVSAAPILDPDGEVTGAVMASQDITRQRELERELQEAMNLAEQRARTMEAVFSALPDAVTVYDANGMTVQVNPAAIETYGMNPVNERREDLINQFSIRTPDGRLLTYEELPSSLAMQGERVNGVSLLFTNAKGETLNILASASPIYTAGKLSGVVAVWHDITERERLQAELSTERARLKTIIENAPVGIIMADKNGEIVLANPVAEQLIGHPDRSSLRLEPCNTNGQEPLQPVTLLPRAARDGESFIGVELVDCPPGGSRRYILADITPVLDNNGSPEGSVGVFQDITRRKEREEEIEENALRSEVLATLSQAFAQAGLEYQAVLDTIALKISETLADGCIIRLAPEESGWLEPVALHMNNAKAQAAFIEAWDRLREPLESSPVGHVVLSGEPMMMLQTSTREVLDTLRPEVTEVFEQLDVQSLLVEPLRTPKRIIGTMTLIRTHPGDPYTAEDQAFFSDLAERAALAIENAMLHAEVKDLADRDVLTGQFNRRAFFEIGKKEMHLFRRYKQPLSAIMLDIDHFKLINDRYGHALGDQILRMVIDHCRENIRHTDVLGRYGGDEYIILLPKTGLTTAHIIAQRIRNAIAGTPFITEAGPVNVSVSLGVGEAEPEMKEIDTLLEKADRALYAAKRKGRNRVETI